MPRWQKPGGRPGKVLSIAKTIAILAVLRLIGFYAPQRLSEYRVQRLIRSAHEKNRNTIGRLFASSHVSYQSNAAIPEELGKAQLAILRMSRSNEATLLQAYVDIGIGNWKKA